MLLHGADAAAAAALGRHQPLIWAGWRAGARLRIACGHRPQILRESVLCGLYRAFFVPLVVMVARSAWI